MELNKKEISRILGWHNQIQSFTYGKSGITNADKALFYKLQATQQTARTDSAKSCPAYRGVGDEQCLTCTYAPINAEPLS